jgi:hypothetical protein
MRKILFYVLAFGSLFILMSNSECGTPSGGTPLSNSGVRKANVTIKTDGNGNTIEQKNIAERYKRDNDFGAIKHLYIISAYSGQVLLYSTVKGKVTSSGKRLTPISVVDNGGEYIKASYAFDVNIGGHPCRTTEVLQDDGTYGSSIDYLFWFDSKDVYHQQYITGGMILHISDQPLSVKSVVINVEQTNTSKNEK